MPDTQFQSLNSANVQATAAKTRNANSVLHLYQFGFTPNITTSLAELTANECTFAGYTAITIATWSDPFLLGNAWAISGGQQIFRYNSGSGSVGNQAGGWYLVTAGGQLLDVGIFDPTRPVQGDGQVVIVEPIEAFVAG